MAKLALTIDTINPNVLKLEYAVRGPIVIRAAQLKEELAKSDSLPFKEVINCNIGDCHAVGQKPLTFLRQVVALVTYPQLQDSPDFPADAKQRAKRILDSASGHSIGAYSESTGIRIIREDIAKYIEQRDGIPSNFLNVFLSSGASSSIKAVLELLNTGKDGKDRAGVMVPIPQYPLYSATISEYNEYQINYYLDESAGWGFNEKELERALGEASGKCVPRAIVVINPGNPTGQVLSRESIETVLKFAYRHSLVVLADEVYQQNVYHEQAKFISFKRVLHDLGGEISQTVQLASFMSCSKGYMGECGFRGGYCELTNFPSDVQAQLYKCLSASLCSTTVGQALLDVVVNPPKEGEPSYANFVKERDQVLGDLKTKAAMVTKTFNSLTGFQCNPVQGAMYAFPKFELPQKAIEAAKAKKQEPDFFYCMQLLETTGVCVVPGSGFGQQPGTFHFRTTILPPVEKMKTVMKAIQEFHLKFLQQYS